MTARKDLRLDQADLYPNDTDPAVATAIARASDRTPTAPTKTDDEKMHIFWRVFGGAIVSIVALTGITLYNHTQNSIGELRSIINKMSEERGDLIRKEEFNNRSNANYERVTNLQGQAATLNASLLSLKTEQDANKERINKAVTDLEMFRKDSAVSLDSLKKELAAIETQKERTAAILADLKQLKDDTAKVRTELERNQIADQERRTQRDEQLKAIEKVIKEAQAALQEMQVKLARLEGQTQSKPADPPKPKEKEEE